MIKAGIDIGTNTILLLVAKVEEGVIQEVLRDEVRIVRLGEGVDCPHEEETRSRVPTGILAGLFSQSESD